MRTNDIADDFCSMMLEPGVLIHLIDFQFLDLDVRKSHLQNITAVVKSGMLAYFANMLLFISY